MQRYLCIHGHFYQPPRENPWLEAVELQDSAYPYHDWNERITVECYAPNAASRILNTEGQIERIVNNYSRISFNFGPTLLSWLEERSPEVHQAIVEADAEGIPRYGGHGPALAQVYNHMILPLANRRDRWTQVVWGIADFRRRFRRDPEGMWLSETAADLESLDILAEQGIRFTILAPRQARRVRKPGGRAWRDVSGSRIDPTRPYRVDLPSGRKIVVFFYDGPISQAVAFEGLLRDGERLAERLQSGFDGKRDWPQLVHIATDGETYGHHHPHGDMALAYALDRIDADPGVELGIYGEYLERHPPTHQVEIFERSSWSCVHGVERWWSDCGCSSGGHPGWRQSWRTPLRNALDSLRDFLAPRFEAEARSLLRDPWAARDGYIDVVLDRGRESQDRFLAQHAVRPLDPGERTRVWQLLEMQRHAMLMYTSCGWFFDELSGIETVQVIQYAGRAIQLARARLPEDPEPMFLDQLAQARSNLTDHGDGRAIYEKFVRPAMVDLPKVAAHYAISSLFEDYPERARIAAFEAERLDDRRREAGKARLVLGRARFTSRITGEGEDLTFGVLHLGDHNVQAAVRAFRGSEAFDGLEAECEAAFDAGDIPAVIRLLDSHFEGVSLSLRNLFRDAQRRVLNRILETTVAEAEAALRQIYQHQAPLMRFLADLGSPPPKALRAAAEVIFNVDLRRVVAGDPFDPTRVRQLLQAAARERIEMDEAGLAFSFAATLELLVERAQAAGLAEEPLAALEGAAELLVELPFPVDLWRVQNRYYRLLCPPPSRKRPPDAGGREPALEERLARIGAALGVRLAAP